MIDQYNTTKTNKFGNGIAYFKMIGNTQKLKPLFEVNDTEGGLLTCLCWLTPEEDTILKVKSQWIHVSEDLIQQEPYNLNIDFTSYTVEVDETIIKGYYAKISNVKKGNRFQLT